MKKYVLLLVLVGLLIGPSVRAPEAQVSTVVPSYVNNAVACTDASASVAFSMSASMVSVTNVGANEVFVRFDDTTATTSNGLQIDAGQSFTLQSRDRWSRNLTCINSSGETTTLRVGAYR